MTTATRLRSHTQWALMTRIRQHGQHQPAATALLAATDASVDDLTRLEAAGLVEATFNGEKVDATVALTSFGKDKVRLRLTSSGRTTLHSDPRSKILDRLVRASNYTAPLREVLRAADTDTQAFYVLEGRGVIVAAMGRTGPEVALEPQMLRSDTNFIHLRLTPAGRELARTSSDS